VLKIYSPGIGRKKSMKLKMKKLVSLGLVSAMSLTMLAGCGNSNGATNDTGSSKNQESKAAGDVKIAVL
jgi:hypothetical protein